MNRKQLIDTYIAFFKEKGHAVIHSAPLIPEHDPTVLFTTAGMHPLVPFLMGQKHPLGKRLVNVQKCIRTQDIDEVGDETHTTFFEMLGNWSLGDYFKKDAIAWSWEFLTSKHWLGLDPKRLAVSCFAGDDDAPRDDDAANVWMSLGVPKERIAYLLKSDNWWGPAGSTGPCGPDTEMFYWAPNDDHAPKKFDPKDTRWVEIWNDVFMQYNKTNGGKYEPLAHKNVDTGLGVERVTMVLQGKTNIFEIEELKNILTKVAEITNTQPTPENIRSFRIIVDHMRAATFILGDERGVAPSNVDQGYVLRRYIRRSLRHLRLLGMDLSKMNACEEIAKVVIELFQADYPILHDRRTFIIEELRREEEKFQRTLDKGLKEFDRIAKLGKIDAQQAFLLYQSYGFPIEVIQELAQEKRMRVDVEAFQKEYEKHQELSRRGAEQHFKGGLADASDATVKLHTATHLLGEALRRVLKNPSIRQKGSNITTERLRYDFNFDRKLTAEEIRGVEAEVNKHIKEHLDVQRHEMTLHEALHSGAQSEFGTRYPDQVSVYTVGSFSKEICGGPHVANTKELGRFKILKEEAVSAGVRRIKATLEAAS